MPVESHEIIFLLQGISTEASRVVGLGVTVVAGSGESIMAPTDKKRLLLLCGASLLAIQLIALPMGLPDRSATFAIQAAHAQEASCFVAGTLVLMADGTERPIETLRPGDAVLGRRGQVNRVVASERTLLGRRRLYAFNGRRPFVTAEHPFLTCEGWKALDPEATRRENEHLHVAALQLGDRICRGAARRVAVRGTVADSERSLLFIQSTTALEALAGVEADPQTPLFNLLLDGDHSYVADGWIVHNKEGRSDDGGSAGDDQSSGDAGGSSGGAQEAVGGADGPAGTTSGAARDAQGGRTGRSNSTATTSEGAKPADRPGQVKDPASRGALDSFLQTLGIGDPGDAGLKPEGVPLSREQEQKVIDEGWEQPK
jgi:hypothetical protein